MPSLLIWFGLATTLVYLVVQVTLGDKNLVDFWVPSLVLVTMGVFGKLLQCVRIDEDEEGFQSCEVPQKELSDTMLVSHKKPQQK